MSMSGDLLDSPAGKVQSCTSKPAPSKDHRTGSPQSGATFPSETTSARRPVTHAAAVAPTRWMRPRPIETA